MTRSFVQVADYRFKSEVLKSGIVKEQRDISLALYSHFALVEYGLVIHCNLDYQTAICRRTFLLENYPNEWKEAENINRAFYQRVKRLKDRISKMLCAGNCLFLTLTFTDEVLLSTSALTRRRYITRFLKSFDTRYIANIDFGEKNHREHYHAVILLDRIDTSLYPYGALNVQKVRSTSDFTKLSKYISKLTNHAIKETTKRNCVLYSR